MTRPSDDELLEYVLGTLPETRAHELDAALARSAELQREVQQMRATLGRLPEQLPRVAPRAGGRSALLAALGSSARYAPFVDELADHFDLPAAQVRELLRSSDDDATWQTSPLEGVFLIDFASGPNAIAEHAGFVRFPKGLQFPYHRHFGPEINYVLRGSMLADDGRLFIPGEALTMPAGSAHSFSFPHEETMVGVIHQGFEFVERPG